MIATALSGNSANIDDESSAPSYNDNENKADSFLSQMAFNLNKKVQDSHPKTLEGNMDLLDTNAKMKQWAGKYDKEKMQTKLKNRIANNSVFLLVYGTCPYCQKIIDILRSHRKIDSADGIMRIVDLDALGLEKYAIRTEVMELVPNHHTIPALWIGGQFIGGCEQLEQLQNQNRLRQLLEDAFPV